MSGVDLTNLTVKLDLSPLSKPGLTEQDRQKEVENNLKTGRQKLGDQYIRLHIQRQAAAVAAYLITILNPSKPGEPERTNLKEGFSFATALQTLLEAPGTPQLAGLLRQAHQRYQNKARMQGKPSLAEKSEFASSLDYLAKQVVELSQTTSDQEAYVGPLSQARADLQELGLEARRLLEQNATAIELDRALWEQEFVATVALELARVSRLAQEE